MPIELDTILTLLPYLGILLSWLFRDRILNILNVRLKKNEVEYSTTENLSQNLKLYQELLDDYSVRANKNSDILENRIKALELEQEEKETYIITLNGKLDEITRMLKKSTRQVEYYAKYSKIELPEDLR